MKPTQPLPPICYITSISFGGVSTNLCKPGTHESSRAFWPVYFQRTFLGLLALSLLVAGCKAPDQKPFQEYATAVHKAGDSMDQALSRDVDWSREKYIVSVLNDSVKLGETAILDKQGPFNVVFPVANGITNQPTFYRLQNVRLTLAAMNDATKRYVDLLSALASSDLVNPASFESMAKDVNTSFNSMAKTFNAQLPDKAVPVFSVAASEIMHMIVEHRRDKALERILERSQKGIEEYCSRCRDLLRIMDQSLTTDYDTQANALEDAFSKIPVDKRPSDVAARKLVEQLLQLNTDYLALNKSLISAKKIYETLPEGHRDLLKSIQSKPTTLEAIKELSEEGQRLKHIYDGLNK